MTQQSGKAIYLRFRYKTYVSMRNLSCRRYGRAIAQFTCFALWASAVQAEDLIEAYREALAHDAQYAGARANQQAGQEKYVQGRAGLLPNMTLNANTTWNQQDSQLRAPDASVVSPRFNSHGWNAQLTQPLFRWQNWVAYRQGELKAVGADLQLLNARQDLMLRVSQAYFDVLLAQDALATTHAQVAALKEQLASAKRNYELGTSAITDSVEAKSRFDLATAQDIAAQSDLLVKEQILISLTGKTTSNLKHFGRDVVLGQPTPDSPQRWMEQAEQSNLNVQIAENALESASREIEKQRAGHLPTLDLVVTRGQAIQGTNLAYGIATPGTEVNTTTVGVQLSIPLYTGGSISSHAREAIALREKALADLQYAKHVASNNAKQAYLGVTSGLAQVKAYEAALESSKLSVDANKRASQVGLRVNIDVLNAQGQYYDTQQKLAKARLDTLLAHLKLKSAAGNLCEDDLTAVNGLLK
jgi:outer membrane protein